MTTAKSTKIWSSELEDFRDLIKEYYKAMAAEEAYKRFFSVGGIVPEAKYRYEKYAANITRATKRNQYNKEETNTALDEQGITTRTQAQVAIDEANFSRGRGEFRKVGVLSGLDPEHFSEYEVRATPNGLWEEIAKKEGTQLDNWRRDNLSYNTGVKFTKPSGTSLCPYTLMREEFDAAAFTDPLDLADENVTASRANAERAGSPGAKILFYENKYLFLMSYTTVAYLLKETYGGDGSSARRQLATKVAQAHKTLVDSQRASNADDLFTEGWTSSAGWSARRVNKADSPEPPPEVFVKTNDRGIPLPSEPSAYSAFYADTKNTSTRPAVSSFIQAMIGEMSTYDDILSKVMGEMPAGFGFDADSLFEGDKWEKLVFDETKAILSFFKADKDPDPLPDAPEFDNLDQIVVDKEAGKKYLKKVEAVRRSLVPRDLQCYLLKTSRPSPSNVLPGVLSLRTTNI